MSPGSGGGDVFLGQELAQRRDYSESTARQTDEAVRALLDDAFERATRTLESHRETLDKLAGALREKEELSGEELEAILNGKGDPREEEDGNAERN